LSLLFIISALIVLGRTTSLLELLDPALEPLNLHLRDRIAMPIGGFKLRHIAGDALIDPLKTSLHLGFGEVLVACIDSFEL
jgi:hypothetical protein